jgi:hypothetical protein
VFYLPPRSLVGNPSSIAVIGAGFLVLAVWLYYVRRQLAWPALLAAGVWYAFAAWEWHALRRGWDIRVDLLLFGVWPVILCASVYGVLFSIRRRRSLSIQAMLGLLAIVAFIFGLAALEQQSFRKYR